MKKEVLRYTYSEILTISRLIRKLNSKQKFTITAKDDAANPCPIDEIARKEKFLRKQIYDMECTEKDYMRQIADSKTDPVAEEAQKKCCTSPRKNRDEIAKERLSLLESYSQKLSSNLQTLEKNHLGLAQETRKLSQVLDETRKDCFEKQELKEDDSPCGTKDAKRAAPQESEQNVDCSCEILPKVLRISI